MTIKIETKSGDFSYNCGDGENLLYAGLRSGLSLPYECGTGTCGTCRARVMSGSATMAWEAAPGAAKLKRDKGDVLLCQAHAEGACVLRVPAIVSAEPGRHEVPAHFNATIDVAKKLTHDVMHFELALDRPISFDAGQFIAIECPAVTGGRAYSMVNFARGTDRLAFVVKQKPDGGFSDWLFGNDPVGAKVRFFGPLGRATFHPDEKKNLVMVAGGSGIAGMMAITQRAVDEEHFADHEGHVYFGVRTLADAFYMAEFAQFIERAGGGLAVTLALSHEAAPGPNHPAFPNIKLGNGFVHEVAAAAMAGQFGNVAGYVAGPPPMVDAALRVLLMGGVPSEFIRYDKFA